MPKDQRQSSTSAQPIMAQHRFWSRVQPWVSDVTIGILLFVGACVARVYLAHIPNFSPVAAIALFSGLWISRAYLAWIVPVGVMLATDAMLKRGGYELPITFMVYGSLAFPCLIGSWIRRQGLKSKLASSNMASAEKSSLGSGVVLGLKVVATTLLGSLLFFFVTNLACWCFWYEPSINGLSQCFSNAIPFFRFTLAGDLTFTFALGTIHALAVSISTSKSRSEVSHAS